MTSCWLLAATCNRRCNFFSNGIQSGERERRFVAWYPASNDQPSVMHASVRVCLDRRPAIEKPAPSIVLVNRGLSVTDAPKQPDKRLVVGAGYSYEATSRSPDWMPFREKNCSGVQVAASSQQEVIGETLSRDCRNRHSRLGGRQA